jgi:lysine-N-methylase
LCGSRHTALSRSQERRLPESLPIRSTYAASFRCIGSACEDTCCQGWSVPIDQASYEKFQSLPASPLRTLIDTSILAMPEGAESATYAKIQMNGESQCPLLTADLLCSIHAQMGEAFLSHACATYPRVLQTVGGVEETALTLSCPEAARLVLLNPALLTHDLSAAEDSVGEVAEAPATDEPPLLLPWSRSIRQTVLVLVVNRAYPLWQRLFLLGVFCRRLDSIAKGELQRSLPAFLADFEASVASGALRTAMEALPLDRTAQLDVVLRLAGILLRRSNVSPRFVECVLAFTTGIGNGPGATLESLADHYARAYDRFYAPFFDRYPYILENYLVNTILRRRFPFGKEDVQAATQPSMAREYALLTAQFALVKGFLIGVAGFHGEKFSAENIVHTVQAISKHFEHHPEFLDLAYELLKESQMDGARGLAILLRNAEPKPLSPAAPEIHAPGPQDGVPSVSQAWLRSNPQISRKSA